MGDLYFPFAITRDGCGLFTSTGVSSPEECIKQFEIWEDYEFNIADAYYDHNNHRTRFVKRNGKWDVWCREEIKGMGGL